MEKRVFISHSQKDKVITDLICNSLEQAGIDCWIAPRDIPYGTDWAGEITDAIKSSELFLFILSQNSNISRQCPKEITVADSANIPILCVAVDDVKMNSSLEYHLSNKQAVFVNASRINEEIDNIVFSVTSGLADLTAFSSGAKANQDLEIAFAKKYNAGLSQKQPSLLEQKLNQKLIASFMQRWEGTHTDSTSDSTPLYTKEDFDDEGVLSPVNESGKRVLHGVHFSLTVDSETVIVAYRTVTNYNIKELKYQYCLERLDSTIVSDTEYDDCKKEKMFFVDIPEEYVNITILSFNINNDYVVINEGLLDTKVGKIKLTKASIMHFQTYTAQDHTKTVKVKTPRSIVSIDPQTGKEIEQELVLTNNGEERYVTLESSKSYFAFKVEEEYQDMEAEDIGDYYRKGLHAFPRNTYQALLWYEKASTAEAYRKMADIFMNDPIFKDESLAVEYAQKYLEMQETNK